MSADPRLVADIQLAEGCKLEAYKDTLSNWTIGYGHLLPKPITPDAWAGFTIPQAVADRYLAEDLARSIAGTAKMPEYGSCDTDCRKNALIELVFNMGAGTWQKFQKTREAIQMQHWQIAHDQLLDSVWAKQVQPHGFDKPGRATRLADYLLTGEYA